MFIPATQKELKELGWTELDVILVSGDVYIDTSFSGVAIIGKWLLRNGFKVGIISQPSLSNDDILRLGIPKLFWGVSGGGMDSMVSNRTASNRRRNNDDLSVNGINNRPDRACIRYTNLIRQYDKGSKIVLGGIEASLRRVIHYDYWDNNLRRSILLDSKADYLVYGEGERTILELSNRLREGKEVNDIRGLCYISNQYPNLSDYIFLPSFMEVKNDKNKFIEMFNLFYQNNDPLNSVGLVQEYEGNRYVVQNPPNYYLIDKELDTIYEMDYENAVHPSQKGVVKGLETTMFSITTHRGCFGECNFCAIAVHQGKTIRSRTKESIIREATKMTTDRRFKGNINDLGGPTANMYMMECNVQNKQGSCKNKRCLFPNQCKHRNINHNHHLELIKAVLNIPKIKKVFINSGLRYDLIQFDKKVGTKYLEYIITKSTSGQMKIAPEHTENKVLNAMAKPNANLQKFINDFYKITKKNNKKQFLTYYFIAGHPACSINEMREMTKKLKQYDIQSQQIQIFTPTPSTYSTLMYWTEIDYKTGEKIFVEKLLKKLQQQKQTITCQFNNNTK